MRTVIAFFTYECRWRTGAWRRHLCIRIYIDLNGRRRSSWSWQRHFTGYLDQLTTSAPFTWRQLVYLTVKYSIQDLVTVTLDSRQVTNCSNNPTCIDKTGYKTIPHNQLTSDQGYAYHYWHCRNNNFHQFFKPWLIDCIHILYTCIHLLRIL